MDMFDVWFAVLCGLVSAAGMLSLAARLPRRPVPAPARVALSIAWLLAACAVAGLRMSFLQTFAFLVPVFALAVLTTRETSPQQAVYLSCVGFITYDFALVIGLNCAFLLFLKDSGLPLPAVEGLMLAVVAASEAGACVLARKAECTAEFKLSMGQTALVLAAMLPYLYVRGGLYTLAFDVPVGTGYAGEVVLILLTMLPTVVVIVGMRCVLSAQIAEGELARMRSLLEQQHRQYLIKRDTIELMNRKFHDLKHFENAVGASVLTGGEAVLGGVSPFVDTGDALVDVIVSEKAAFCEEQGIRLVPMIDARRLGFVKPLDMCCLLGNALDNAIEAVLEVEDPELREVRAKMGILGGMVVLNVTNRYATEPRPLRGGEFESTKSPRDYVAAQGALPPERGYGIKNMRSVAERLGGSLDCVFGEGEFSLTVMFPAQ